MAMCRDCKLYDLDAVKDKAGRVRKDRVGRCLWESKEVLPLSIRGNPMKLVGGWMEPNDGNGCKRFIPRG